MFRLKTLFDIHNCNFLETLRGLIIFFRKIKVSNNGFFLKHPPLKISGYAPGVGYASSVEISRS